MSIVIKVLVYSGSSTLEVGVGRMYFCYKEIGAMPLNVSDLAACVQNIIKLMFNGVHFFFPSAKADGNEPVCNKCDGQYVLKGQYSLAQWQRLGLECKKTNPAP